MSRGFLAVLLGLISFPLSFAIAEPLLSKYGGAGLAAAFVVMAVYFFVCQFFLSRGNPDALFKDWPIMLGLDATQLIMVVLIVLLERLDVVLSQGLGILLSCCGGTLAGAFVASNSARRKAEAEAS
jgi:hypothetical protein